MSRGLSVCSLVLVAALGAGCADTDDVAVPDLPCSGGDDGSRPTASYESLRRDVLTNADYWEEEPRILAAGLGFTDIIGVPGLTSGDPAVQEQSVLDAGGAWNIVDTMASMVGLRAYTSAASPPAVAFSYGWPVQFCDGLPIEFSWPVRASTVDGSDFRVILNDGEVVTPVVASVMPNFEYNERSTVVIFGGFGNRLASDEEGARYPVRFEIARDETPLELLGPGGRIFDAVGLSFGDGENPLTAYDQGPTLVAAKLSHMSVAGEGGPTAFNAQIPNDGVALYGDAAEYRLRILTTGGFSPDGVHSMLPTEFSRYFRVRVVDSAGNVHWIEEAEQTYVIDGGELTILGLADLGVVMSEYDDAYIEDHDNQIDIVLAGDESVMRLITDVDIPAGDGYSPFYNPGGPGNDPQRGVRFSERGPPTLQPVTIALDDPMTVDWPPAP